MVTTRSGRRLLALIALSRAACGSVRQPEATVVRPGAPGAPSRTESATTPPVQRAYSPADVHFMHGMIAHHAQALEMTALVDERTSREDVRRLAQRIALSQADEIERMKRWLTQRNEPVAATHHMHMPGMLSADDLERLRRATGAEFERLFLELMIRHHEGALTMVAELLATPGAGQEPELYQFATDVDADQRGEIARMRRMLTPTGR
jgi:uncharacterized protein (DUF305 family)